MQNNSNDWIIIAGISQGFGQSLAKTFAQAGFNIAGIARTNKASAAIAETVEHMGKEYLHVEGDIADSHSMQKQIDLFGNTHKISGAIHNAHHLLIDDFENISAEQFELCWQVVALGGFNLAKATIPHMLKHGGGTLIFSGATASLKAGSKFSAFASAKFALRGLTQSLMRTYASQNIHVVHTILDGLIWSPQTTARFAPKQENCIDPDALAASYLRIFEQPNSAWTNEIDFRPLTEKF